MICSRRRRTVFLSGIALLTPAASWSQDAPTSDPAVVPPPQAAPTTSGLVYTPADFARFAPKTAYDLIAQVPGFTIREADSERGLGQASENLLINGQRVADKSGGAGAQLRNTAVSRVERIEIVDAAQLGIAGLTGLVANVVLKAAAKSGGGSFEWSPEVRSYYAHPNWFRGKVSYNGASGPIDYTFTIDNQASRGAYGGGDFTLSDASGTEFESRDPVLVSDYDQLAVTSRFKVDAPGSSLLNVSAKFTPIKQYFSVVEDVTRADGDDNIRDVKQTRSAFSMDLNGDYEFALGPGRMKLIGLRHYEHQPVVTTIVTTFDSGAADSGFRFKRDARLGETVARGEYKWRVGKNDWQVSLERAFNSLEQDGTFLQLDPDGVFQPVDVANLSGEVREVRYEAVASLSRPLTDRLDLQVAAGGETSKLERVDGDVPARKFFRPKGSVVLGWRPAKSWDASLSLRRRVGQISFYDFLTQPNLQQDKQNSGNPDLVPPQSWEAEGEVGKDLGAWGKTRLKLYAHRIDDIIDVIPIGADGEGIGNLPRATRLGFESTSTIQLDPIGWKGAKIDATLSRQFSRVRDPLTGERRPISGADRYTIYVGLRHDIPNSKWAWGASIDSYRTYDFYYLTEISNNFEGPFTNIFIEHKDVLGLKVRFDATNLNFGPHREDRIVYDGRRNVSPISYVEYQNERIGPIFRLRITGNF